MLQLPGGGISASLQKSPGSAENAVSKEAADGQDNRTG
jgi:hypothetical protein